MKLSAVNIYLDFAYVAGLICFSVIFYFNIKIIFLTSFVIIASMTAAVIKLLYWYYTRKALLKTSTYNIQKSFFLRFVSCILIYIAPVYCIIQEPNLVISHFVATTTFAIVSILAIIGVIIERLFSINEKKNI